MKIDRNLWRGVESLLDDYAGIRGNDIVLLLYTIDSRDSAIWVSTALTIRQISHHRMWMAPVVDKDFATRLEPILPDPASLTSRLVVLTFERSTLSHSQELTQILDRYDPARVAVFRAISACAELFRNALRASPVDLSARNTAILEKCMGAKRLRICTGGGTDLQVGLSDRHRWISNRGFSRAGGTVILPAGEVATYPDSISGIHVADFAFNVNAVVPHDVRLDRHPVTLRIENGHVVDFRCDDNETMRFLRGTFDRQCAANVGELGFGTNFHVDRPIAMNSHINERRPGVHLGLGQHNQVADIVEYQCSLHLDLIARGGKIWVDDDPAPIDLECLEPSTRTHPASPRDEDVFSSGPDDLEDADCCGLSLASDFPSAVCPAA